MRSPFDAFLSVWRTVLVICDDKLLIPIDRQCSMENYSSLEVLSSSSCNEAQMIASKLPLPRTWSRPHYDPLQSKRGAINLRAHNLMNEVYPPGAPFARNKTVLFFNKIHYRGPPSCLFHRHVLHTFLHGKRVFPLFAAAPLLRVVMQSLQGRRRRLFAPRHRPRSLSCFLTLIATSWTCDAFRTDVDSDVFLPSGGGGGANGFRHAFLSPFRTVVIGVSPKKNKKNICLKCFTSVIATLVLNSHACNCIGSPGNRFRSLGRCSGRRWTMTTGSTTGFGR